MDSRQPNIKSRSQATHHQTGYETVFGERKAQSFTLFSTIIPLIAPKEDMDRVVDLFDGVIEIYETQDSEGRLRRFLTVKKMYGQKYSATELIIDRNKLF